jgi:hypothetical protein
MERYLSGKRQNSVPELDQIIKAGINNRFYDIHIHFMILMDDGVSEMDRFFLSFSANPLSMTCFRCNRSKLSALDVGIKPMQI